MSAKKESRLLANKVCKESDTSLGDYSYGECVCEPDPDRRSNQICKLELQYACE